MRSRQRGGIAAGAATLGMEVVRDAVADDPAGTPGALELLQRSRAGDGAAFGLLLAQYSRYLSLLARLRIGRDLQGKADADDVVQEAFLEAHRNFTQFRGDTEAEFLAWLRQILAGRLAHLMRHYLGARGRDARLERQLAHDLDESAHGLAGVLVSPASSPSRQAVRREQAVLLADALSALPEHYREVIVLRHLEGLSFVEVAARMQRSEDSVQKLWVRALALLRQSIPEES
jgi:RNA polymerase sigma-70 factor (ECF subfamily)